MDGRRMMGESNKAELLKALIPRAGLLPLTVDALNTLPVEQMKRGLLGLYAFPFRIGRESRLQRDEKTGQFHRIERVKPGGHKTNNDIYLIDSGKLLNISREHLSIELQDGEFVVVDRGSACGFAINGQHTGGHDKGGRANIRDGDELVLGIVTSPFRFRFIDFSGYGVAGP